MTVGEREGTLCRPNATESLDFSAGSTEVNKMATGGVNTAHITPLDGTNYATWKLQCQMALMKDGLSRFVNETSARPFDAAGMDAQNKFDTKRDRALAIIVLSIDPSLLYLVGDPVDPVAVWGLLKDQFQKKSWANRLPLRKRLYSLRLKEGGSMKEHIKIITDF